MRVLKTLRNQVSDFLWLRALRRHRSRMGYRDAPRYTAYLREAQHAYGPWRTDDRIAEEQAAHYRDHGWAAFSTPETEKLGRSMLEKLQAEEAGGLAVWQANGRYNLGDVWLRFPQLEELFQGTTGEFLRGIFQAHYKIFYGIAYKSRRQREDPIGSELWHADGGPGTCVNLMFCLSHSARRNGAMECLSWKDSYEIFRRERVPMRRRLATAGKLDKVGERALRAEFYRDVIAADFSDRIVQPTGGPGIVYAFGNNLLHKGGFPEAGGERYVCVFHIYPSREPTIFERYRAAGVPKVAPLPRDPAF